MIGGWTPSSVIGKIAMRPEEFRWVALQAEDTPAALIPEIVGECHRLGLLCGVWEAAVDYGSPAVTARGYDFWIGQCEGPGQYDRVASSLDSFRFEHPELPAAVVTNFGGLDTAALAAPLIEHGLFCIVEAHYAEEGYVDKIASRVDYAQRVLHWPGPQPMAGLGNGATLSDYPDLGNYSGWSVFAAEELL